MAENSKCLFSTRLCHGTHSSQRIWNIKWCFLLTLLNFLISTMVWCYELNLNNFRHRRGYKANNGVINFFYVAERQWGFCKIWIFPKKKRYHAKKKLVINIDQWYQNGKFKTRREVSQINASPLEIKDKLVLIFKFN